ncbi:MAG: hypothetical protein ACE5QF_02485 [Thermoplasmata archaeon]
MNHPAHLAEAQAAAEANLAARIPNDMTLLNPPEFGGPQDEKNAG